MTQSSYSLTLYRFLLSFSILLSKSLPLNPSTSQNLFGSFSCGSDSSFDLCCHGSVANKYLDDSDIFWYFSDFWQPCSVIAKQLGVHLGAAAAITSGGTYGTNSSNCYSIVLHSSHAKSGKAALLIFFQQFRQQHSRCTQQIVCSVVHQVSQMYSHFSKKGTPRHLFFAVNTRICPQWCNNPHWCRYTGWRLDINLSKQVPTICTCLHVQVCSQGRLLLMSLNRKHK